MPLSASERVDLVTSPGVSAALSDETRISPAAAWDSTLAAILTVPPIAVKSLRTVENSPIST
jgi:hypothetical protein